MPIDEHPWRVFEERVRTGPYGLSRFPLPPHSPIRILILDESFVDSINPGLRRFIENSPPRIRGQWESQEDPTGLTQDEFKEVMKKLRKQTYNPTYPKNRARRRGLFSCRKTGAPSHQEEEGKEEAKDCTICLETFISNQTVLVTPCNHMFHNDCLMPWIKNHGECPFCRFKLCERRRERVPPPLLPAPHHHNNDNASVAAVGGGNIDNITAGELLALIRAMEEAFNWVTLSP
ncbi:E3 ubiquitin-protein ligase RING1-like [Acorus gramineus]|uniref:E3 ubiquitin-protein ligase RING1-like n=1 Tax=Acorus gramineus TaxID=55184 RepID=A0AAV9A288_ACOGR|nr:E3 ubiquitin-protein ligase RING1-like [Acorus gramineus]